MFQIPASFTDYIHRALQKAGETVVYKPAGAAEVTLKASVQSPTEAGLVQDAQQTTYVVFLSAKDVTTQPKKFDRLFIRGADYAIEADAGGIGAGGTITAWQCMVTG